MQAEITIDPSLCQQCGACVRECNAHLSAPSGNHVDHTHPLCNRCLHCYAVCPAGAIQVGEAYTLCEADADTPASIAPQTLESFLAYRRSTRRFQDRPLPQELIARVVHAGQLIPSGGNRHAYEFSVITDRAVMEELRTAFAGFYGLLARVLSSAVLRAIGGLVLGPYERAFLRDDEYASRLKRLLGRFREGGDPIFYHAPAVIVVHSSTLIPTPKEDAVLAAYNMVLKAQSLGLGTCFVTMAQKAIQTSKKCKALIGLSRSEQVNAVILLGYPEVAFQRAVPRRLKPIHWV